MPGINKMIDKMQKVQIQNVLSASFKETKKELEELQIGQMLYGVRADGKRIGRYKNKRYAADKFAMNNLAGFGFIDLRYTGEFHKRVVAKIMRGFIIFTSLDPKTPDLEKRFDPFGLNKTSRSTYSTKILPPVFLKNFKNELRRM